jgi:hypothetical protein
MVGYKRAYKLHDVLSLRYYLQALKQHIIAIVSLGKFNSP